VATNVPHTNNGNLAALMQVLGISTARSERPDYVANAQDAGLIIATRPALTLLILLQRTINHGLTAITVKGQSR
jgi:ABC-type glycerol-3-phosphate transport system permease component